MSPPPILSSAALDRWSFLWGWRLLRADQDKRLEADLILLESLDTEPTTLIFATIASRIKRVTSTVVADIRWLVESDYRSRLLETLSGSSRHRRHFAWRTAGLVKSGSLELYLCLSIGLSFTVS